MRCMKLKASIKRDIAEARWAEYPSIGDQLDAIWKILETLGVKDVPQDAAEVMSKVTLVKEKFPKRVK